MLEPGDRLRVGGAPGLSIGCLKLGLLLSPQQSLSGDSHFSRGFLKIALRQQRRNRCLLLPSEFAAVPFHLSLTTESALMPRSR
jgi:hypothetical protein